MKRDEYLDLFTRQQRIAVQIPGLLRETEGSIVRHIAPPGEEGYLSYSLLDEAGVDAVIATQVARFGAISQDFEWKVYDYDPPADLIERLRQHGFAIGEPEAFLLLDLSADAALLRQPLPASLRRVSDPAGVDAVIALEDAIWGYEHRTLADYFRQELREHPQNLSLYLSYAEGRPVAAAWIVYTPGSQFAGLWGGSTLPGYRRQGHYTALLAARAQEAFSRGVSLLTVDASPMSRPILEKHGFQFMAITTPCIYEFKS